MSTERDEHSEQHDNVGDKVMEKEVREQSPIITENYKELSNSLNLVREEWENELSTLFRLGDKRKDAMMNKVDQQIANLHREIKVVMEKMGAKVEQEQMRLEPEVFEILTQAKLLTAERLEHCLDRKLAQSSLIAALCKTLTCCEEELMEEVEKVRSETLTYKRKCTELREEVQDLQLQVKRLTAKVRNMGRAYNYPACTDQSDNDSDRETDTEGPSADLEQHCSGLDPELLLAYAQAKLKQRQCTSVGHRATTSDFSDNSALSLFHRCPGRTPEDEFDCDMKGKTFGDVVADADAVISSLPITSIFSLARYISIFEQERDPDKRNFLMRDKNYVFVTTSGSQKAYAYFKRHCLHTMRDLMRHDGSSLLMRHDGNSGLTVDQVNSLMNEGVRFAMTNSWTDVRVEKKKEKAIFLLPAGFTWFKHAVQFGELTSPFIYKSLSDICKKLRELQEPYNIVFVGPTSSEVPPEGEWMRLSMAFTNVARGGSKIVAVAPPRGEADWEAMRLKVIDLMNTVREAAYATRVNVVTKIPLAPSVSEPALAVGIRSRKNEWTGYPRSVIWDFLSTLVDYVKGDMPLEPLMQVHEQKENRHHDHRQQYESQSYGRLRYRPQIRSSTGGGYAHAPHGGPLREALRGSESHGRGHAYRHPGWGAGRGRGRDRGYHYRPY